LAVSIRIGVQFPSRRRVEQHDVQDDHVIGVFAGHPEPVGAVQGQVDREPLGGQPVAEPGGQPPFVLHHQDPHPRHPPWSKLNGG
jgi:hypothetical protein